MFERGVIIFDIDQTLAGGVVSAHMRGYNEKLNLGMTEEQIVDSDTYSKTFDHPLVRAYRQQDPNILREANWPTFPQSIGIYEVEEAEGNFQESREFNRTSHEVNMNLTALPGSVEGVHDLLTAACDDGHLVFGGYYTVRPPEHLPTTINWLTVKTFKDPERVIICKNPQDKLQRIFNDWWNPGTSLVLFDDRYQELEKAAVEMADGSLDARRMVSHLALIGYGNNKFSGSFYPNIGLRTISMPSWSQKDRRAMETELIETSGFSF